MMNPIKYVRRGRPACRRNGRFATIGVAVGAAVLLTVMLSGCGGSSATPTATATPTPAAAAASIGPVWAQVDAAEIPLFSLTVTEAQGFSAAERNYLHDLQVTWNMIRREATEYAAPGTDAATQAKLAEQIGRQAAVAAAKPSPSGRFSMLHLSARLLMRRVVRLSRLTQRYASTTSVAQKNVLALRITRLAAQLATDAQRVADWGVELRIRFGGLRLAWDTSTETPTPTPTPAPTSSSNPEPGPAPQPNPTPNPTPTPKPGPSITKAEANQIDSLAVFDSWLTAGLDETNDTLENQKMPWTDAEVTSFCLNMSYFQDGCDQWIDTPPAGSHMAAAYNQYIKGLKLFREGATQLISAAQDNNAAAAEAGRKKLNRADKDYLRPAMSKLKAMR